MQITTAQQQQAVELAEKHGFKELYVNVNDEFFTSSNYAANSVGNDKDKWVKVDLSAVPVQSKKAKK